MLKVDYMPMSSDHRSIAPAQDPRVDTVCRAIYALVERAYRDDSHERYDDTITRLASLAMNATDAFNPFILALDERLEKRDYASAVLIARAMVAHEDILLYAVQETAKQGSTRIH